MDFSLLGMWNEMGVVARSVVITLILMSMYAIGISLERFITFRKGRQRSLGYVAELQPLIQSQASLATAVQHQEQWQDAPLARVLGTGLTEFTQGLDELGDGANDAVDLELMVNAVSRSMERSRKREMAELQKGLPVLATIASSAPFVGLFGTVFGIITAFQQMADPSAGGGGLATVSAGIAEALFTTAVGLSVAIIAVWLYNFFTTKVQHFGVMLDDASGELTDRLLHRTRRQGVANPVQQPSPAVQAQVQPPFPSVPPPPPPGVPKVPAE